MKRTLSLFLCLLLLVGFVPLREARAETYTLTFDPNGGGGSTVTKTTDSLGRYILPTPEELGFTAPAGKEFYGWNMGGFIAFVDGLEATFGADTTIKAIWVDAGATICTVYFNTDFANTGVPPITQQPVTAGEKATKPTDPTRGAGFLTPGVSTLR